MKIIRPDIGLLTAKCIDLSLLIDYSTYFKELTIQYGLRLIEIFNNRNCPNTIYFSVRVRLIEVSAEEDRGLQTDKNEGTTGGQQRGNKLWRT